MDGALVGYLETVIYHIQYHHIINVLFSASISHGRLLALVGLLVVGTEKSEENKNEDDIPASLFNSGE